jgi:hypothetical protein
MNGRLCGTSMTALRSGFMSLYFITRGGGHEFNTYSKIKESVIYFSYILGIVVAV